MTWDAHRRDGVLHAVMTLADTRRDGRLPWTEVPGLAEAFGTREALLGALQMRWYTRLSGAIERELVEQPWDLQQAVVHAWRRQRADMPGVRAILDAHADEPAMRRALRKEWTMLASASGLTGMDDPQAPRIGRDVEARARSVRVQEAASADRGRPHRDGHPRRNGHGGWLARLRHALAA